MARATRSTTTHEKDKTQDQPQTSRKGASKKRKRNSNAENEESPVTKHPRTDTKEEDSPDPEEHLEERLAVELPSSRDVPLQDADAANILDVLEMVDTQGLLDRVFPLPTESVEGVSSRSSSPASSSMLSLRTLLKNPSQYPLRILHAAIKHLHPISSHPRFRPSETTAQQLRFCDLATSLLDQASRNNAPVSLDAESTIADTEAEEPATPPSSTHDATAGVRPRKYALVQHLPTGDWWSSASSEVLTADGQGRDLKTLHTAKAELVSIFPSPSGQALAHKGTLGDYVVKRRPNQYRPPQPRRVSCGKFLDYGPYASFAPYFDQDGVEVGRVGMGEVIFYQEMKRRLRSLAKGKRRAFLAANDAAREDVVMEDASCLEDASVAGPPQAEDNLTKGLESLLAPEEVSAIKTALGSLELEQAVDELLQKNAKALQRLEELQLQRLRAQGGGSSVVEVGSEEWDVAQGITDSLGLLASLRPRPSNGDPDYAPLIPPASVLHKLQRTLPLAATEGWYGTLPEGRTTAFHDDTTVHVRATTAATSKPVAAPAPVTPAPKATTPATPYTPYSYSNAYQSTQYRSGYGTYTPAQGSYYPNSNYNVSMTPTATTTTTSSHYPNAQYGTGHSQYYSGWYGNSGRSTPQPGQTGMSGNFSSYFAPGSAQQPQPQRAVANTVLSSAKQSYPQSTWNGTAQGGYVAPTLPPHMRTAAGATSTPGTPTSATPTGTYGYYGGYGAPR